jgi:hypothetical protein
MAESQQGQAPASEGVVDSCWDGLPQTATFDRADFAFETKADMSCFSFKSPANWRNSERMGLT